MTDKITQNPETNDGSSITSLGEGSSISGDIDDILYNEMTLEIAHFLKYNCENNIDNLQYIKKLRNKNLSLSFLRETLLFLISRGIPQAVLFQKEFNIDTSDIGLSFFKKGFINGMHGLEDSEYLVRFINLYKNKQELLEEIGRINLVLLYNLINYYNIKFVKFNKAKSKKILKKFEKTFRDKKLTDKINEIGGNYWYELCLSVFEEYESAYHKIQNIFDFTEDEKEHFEELKQTTFFESYQKEIQLKIKGFEDIDFTKIYKLTMNNSFQGINYETLGKKINELLIGMTIKDSYSIVFLDISGKKEQFNIGNNIELLGYNYKILEKDVFLNHILECFGEFLLNLDKNNMDFTILIFKQNGNKDDIPDEEDEMLVA